MTAVVDEHLFASLEPVSLRGSSCADCGAQVFPAQATCPMCAGVSVTEIALPTQGTVWSWTVQRFEPKAPFRTDDFAPFAIGYVDLGSVIVEGWLLERTSWQIGDRVELALTRAWTDSDGVVVHTYGFRAAA